MGFNFVGTIQTRRRGWCKQIEFPFKKRPEAVPRGEFKMAVANSNPGLVAVAWADSKAVYFLGSQVSVEATTVQRREKNGSISSVPCPALVEEYQRYMGGVDRHDQLRLQSYSMQLSTRFAKYYKGLFLGLVDMVFVNAYIVFSHAEEKKRSKKKKNSHFVFLSNLHQQLISESESSFTQASATGMVTTSSTRQTDESAAPSIDHKLIQNVGTRENGEKKTKRVRQRQCKVCSYYKPTDKKRGGTSMYYCPACSVKLKGRLTLCNKERRVCSGRPAYSRSWLSDGVEALLGKEWKLY
ncbi:Hypothetical protein PHPALM_1206 [Phytophthora palmivora]|uniref:PiggyBac transposable element-derived protein domain-containing protein n=1 Tax=Phytophthora palmivora TaxID=4796 RepID=A0A2P4YSX8_9STRA|nr:Hypothetical protein PHPALM_1206 [Phytophthora palmivora]